MKDLLFFRPFAMKRLAQGELMSETGLIIRAGDVYIEDEDGTLYHLDDFDVTEFYGDLQLTDDGDFALAADEQVDEQDVFIRVNTQAPDFFFHPWIGGNLEDLRGMPNNQDTAEQGVRQILETLTKDGRFGDEIVIRPVPVDQHTLLFYIFKDGRQVLSMPVAIDLT